MEVFAVIFAIIGIIIVKVLFFGGNPYKVKYQALKKENQELRNKVIDLEYKVSQYDEWEIDKS